MQSDTRADATQGRKKAGGSTLPALIDAYDWTATPLGAMKQWPVSVKTTVDIILRSPVPIVTLWGEAGTMIYNDAYSGFAGNRHPKLLGSAVRAGWPEVAAFNDNVMKVVLAGGTLSYTDINLTLARSSALEPVWMNLDYSPIIGEEGRPIGVIAVVVETTEAVLATSRLRDSEDRLKFLDALGKKTAKSSSSTAIVAMTTQELGQHLGASICCYGDVAADDDRIDMRSHWVADGSLQQKDIVRLADLGTPVTAALRRGMPFVVRDAAKDWPGEALSATFMAYGMTAAVWVPVVKEGRLASLLSVFHPSARTWTANELTLIADVADRTWSLVERARLVAVTLASEQRFREELEWKVQERTKALQQSVKTIRTILETSFLNQGLLTTAGAIVYVNATSLAIIDRPFEDVKGKDFWDTPWFATTPGMPEKVREAVAQVAAGQSIRMSMPLNLPTGRRIYDFSMRPAIDAQGRVMALVPEAVEITARVQAEEALRQAQKVEAIGNLTGGIAHDFNNLLMAILGSLELLRKRLPDDPTLLRLVDNAMAGVKRGGSLTSRMLAFARKQDLQPERIDLGQLVYGMTELMQRSLGPQMTVVVQIPEPLAQIEADPNQLEAALLNLVLNARDATDGQGFVTVAARETEVEPGDGRLPAGRYVCLSVRDTGVGMDAETLKRATEPFFTTKGIGKGTGLGLSMVHGLARQSGGALRLASKPGSGTTAEIWLPAAPSSAEAPSPAVSPQSKKVPEMPRAMPSLRIMVVDDDPLILMNLVDMLEDLGHVATEASSGQQALEAMAGDRYDVLITDHAMPRMTGLQLIEAVHAAYPATAVVLATGYVDLPEGGTACEFGRLIKPYSQADLKEALDLAVKRRTSKREPPA